ncbi:MAG: nucleotidyl transferase AbiEii/AbiGii toxin family protein [Propionibacteriaceae bacterium]|jgi:hypothetical protein|nr:nucleotidyl transferase AbiEii/AbiGii toxin family protein [Propionibacteriaceae bacterium]
MTTSASDIPALDDLLTSAARLQELVPDTVLVGGAAVAYRVRHRLSVDHDHVLSDLRDHFDIVLDALEQESDWVTNRAAYGKLILGELGGIETGVRQLIRRHPLEVEEVTLPGGQTLRVPTVDETLRVKAFLIVKRNQTRDYLDVAALADRYGIAHAAEVLSGIDEFYADQAPEGGTVAAQVLAQLADPRPRDEATTKRLSGYKGLAARWHDWNQVVSVCHAVADAMAVD